MFQRLSISILSFLSFTLFTACGELTPQDRASAISPDATTLRSTQNNGQNSAELRVSGGDRDLTHRGCYAKVDECHHRPALNGKTYRFELDVFNMSACHADARKAMFEDCGRQGTVFSVFLTREDGGAYRTIKVADGKSVELERGSFEETETEEPNEVVSAPDHVASPQVPFQLAPPVDGRFVVKQGDRLKCKEVKEQKWFSVTLRKLVGASSQNAQSGHVTFSQLDFSGNQSDWGASDLENTRGFIRTKNKGSYQLFKLQLNHINSSGVDLKIDCIKN